MTRAPSRRPLLRATPQTLAEVFNDTPPRGRAYRAVLVVDVIDHEVIGRRSDEAMRLWAEAMLLESSGHFGLNVVQVRDARIIGVADAPSALNHATRPPPQEHPARERVIQLDKPKPKKSKKPCRKLSSN